MQSAKGSLLIVAVGDHLHGRSYCCAGYHPTSELMKSNVCLLGKGAFCCFCLLTPPFFKSNVRGFFYFFPAVIDKMSIE